METHSQKIGFVLSRGPTDIATRTAITWADAALEAGCSVEIFLFDNGIYNALASRTNKNPLRQLHQLAERGAEICLCANMAKAKGVTPDKAHPCVVFGSLLHFAELVTTADKLLAI